MSYDYDYDYDEIPDEYYEEQHRRRMHGRLMSLPPGHPDEGDILDALEESEDD